MRAMPFDDRTFPSPAGETLRNRRLLAAWLFTLCGMILVMIVLGGATRLTGSGLSIMEWAPLTGALPPLSEAEWQRLYHLYQQIPQYELVNKGFGIAGFKQIFWLEWVHRLWGRLIGIVFIVPLLWLLWRRAVPWITLPRLLLLLALGGLQGAVGWFMVASGFFPDSTAVAPVRLVVHLALALLLYAALLWTGLGVLRPIPSGGNPKGLRRLAQALVVLALLTMLAGAWVAGLHAGLTYNTFPLMDGRLVPESYAALTPFLRNFGANIATVQFNHRLLATLTALSALGAVAMGVTFARGRVRTAAIALGGAVALQYLLGVLTLLWVVPVPLAVAHQAVAVLVLTASLVLLHTLRRA
jgi:cytochrome c oxidase assembly protein subunit 15